MGDNGKHSKMDTAEAHLLANVWQRYVETFIGNPTLDLLSKLLDFTEWKPDMVQEMGLDRDNQNTAQDHQEKHVHLNWMKIRMDFVNLFSFLIFSISRRIYESGFR